MANDFNLLDGSDSQATSSGVSPNTIDAAGDLLVGSADNTITRIAKGGALEVLRVKSDASGLEWASQSVLSVTTQTDSYTLALADAGTCVLMNKATANDLTVPPNSSVAFATGTVIEVHQYGAGQTTIVAGSGVTLRAAVGLKIADQYGSVSLLKIAEDEWLVVGQLEA